MRVKATKPGFYGRLRIPGDEHDEFDVPEGAKASWFEPVDVPMVKASKVKGPARESEDQP